MGYKPLDPPQVGPTFQSGDVVQLRSGGPLLTVTGTGTDKSGSCFFIYFNTITGLFEKAVTDQRCLRGGLGRPELPEGTEQMRSTSVTKSSMSK